MIKSILETIFSRGISALSALGMVLLTAQQMGVKGRGEIALLILSLSIVSIFQNIGTGGNVSYYSTKWKRKKVLLFGVLWSLISSLLIPFCITLGSLAPSTWLMNIILLSMLLGLVTLVQNLFIGLEKISKFNLIEILKNALPLFFCLLLKFFHFKFDFNLVYYSYLSSYFLTFILSIIQLNSVKEDKDIEISKGHFTDFYKMGLQQRLINFLQLINYRFLFIYVEKKFGIKTLGLFSVAFSVAESLWIISKSLATILYAKLLNVAVGNKFNLVFLYSKLSYLATSIGAIFLLFVPNSFYAFIFGSEFAGLNSILYSILPGIVLMAFSTTLHHYFLAHGKVAVTIYSTLLSNIILLFLCYCIFYNQKVENLGYTLSFAYFSMLVYLLLKFKKESNISLKHFFNQYNSILKELKAP